MKHNAWGRFFSLLLVLSLLLGLAPATYASERKSSAATFKEIPDSQISANLLQEESLGRVNEECTHAPEDTVRASIVLDKKPVLAIYSTNGIAANASAQQYRETVHTEQQRVEARISKAIGQELDVVWNLTITANVISANIRYGDLDKIAATEGVAQVLLETRYTPCVAEVGGEEPNMASATTMTGSNAAWLAGYTGAGSRIAIIDTGLDIDHQSVNEAAFLYALEKNAEAAQTATDSYLKELNLLDVEEIAQILPQLNIYQGYRNVSGEFIKDTSLTADELYRSSKIAFGYNYIDRDLDVTHDNDDQGGHGSHVAGIAAANRYIPSGDGFTAAASTAHMTGVAPDAQLMIMKVFGKNQGAYDSDYMAAIEDAILLGADVINLSLGSSMAGFTTASAYYQGIVDSLSSTDVVVVISAGNNSAWSVPSSQGYLYAEDVNFHTGGSPGTYQNAFTVASVDNCGMTAPSFRIGNHVVTYAENQSGHNAKLTTLDISADHSGTDYDYVVLNGPGKPEDYANMDVAGKVIYISRGELNFSDKLTYAAQAGAAACIIYNNAAGAAPNMNLADSPAAIPCVGITQADADTIKAISQMVQDEAGNALYYIGTMRIGDWVDTVVSDSEYNTMSDFSSWGVPGDLSLKPEITSPGGNIYSIDGDTSETDRYIVMSGTSMAAPHVAGLIALLSQYIHENGLAERLHISPRVLSQSLLMSTATPIVDGGSGLPYPVIQQGAGLGNVYNAMNAVSYVLVEGQDDGKVKAELGDDSSRTGEYGFDFTLHNMTGEAQRYTLDTQMYTQAWFESHISANLDGLTNFTDYSMTQLDVQVAYFVDGKEILSENGQLDGLDFNGDGSVDQLDGQTLLDYITGKLDALENLEKADLSGDGKLTAYDAELFLAQLGNLVVTLPANETVTVSVKLKLPQSVKNQLDEIYPNGAYLEGYVTATPMATAEGVIASAHSIPVLGFYGGWDEAPMFDRLTHTQIAAGTYTRNSYIPSMFISDFNYVLASDGENLYYLGGNPYATDAAYLPERNAIRSGGKEMIAAMNFNLIRNAGILRASVTDADTGAVYAEGEFPQVYSSFYHPASGAWQYMSQHVVPGTGENGGWNVTDAAGVPLAEGTRVHLTLQAAPEYYVKADGDVDWDTLHSENSILRLPVTVDNTAPVLKELSIGIRKDMVTGKETNYAEVVVQDNLYTAAVLVLTPSGSKVIQRKSANQAEPGVPVTIRMDTSGDAFKLAVIDYAGNVTYYDVTASSGTNMPVATLYGATGTHDAAAWYRFSSDTNFDNELILETEQNIKGAVYADGYVFYCGRPKGAVDDQA